MAGMALPRAVTVSLATTATLATAAGLWLDAGSGSTTTSAFVRYAAVAAGTSALGAFALWHRPRNRYGLTHLAIGVLFGSVVLAAGVLAQAPASLPRWVEGAALAWSWLAVIPLLPLWVVAIATFPDGGFHRAGLRRATLVLTGIMAVLAVTAYLIAPAGEPPPLIRVDVPAYLRGPLAGAGPGLLFQVVSATAAALGALAPIAAVVALLDRFRRSGPVVRQQIKWLLLGATVSVVLQAIPVEALDSAALQTTARVLVVIAVPLPFVAAAIAILKYGLWEIDVVISKGIVYAVASALLSVPFLGIALVAGVSVAGRDTQVVAALALALLVSFLAQPLRRRLETLVARALYGAEPPGLLALARLGDAGGAVLDARGLGSRIATVARHAMGASWAGVWLYLKSGPSGSLRPLAVSGGVERPSVVVPDDIADALVALSGGRLLADIPADVAETLRPLLEDDTAVVTALISAGELRGLIVCGERAKGGFRDEDVEFLAALGRESALALRNIHLEGELRQRIDQVEQQASELHRSRRRLVTVQDQERRRIERDLHDGAQQSLVSLAARLRRAAHADDPPAHGELVELADDAEDAVFTLQELARGIYPSLLADRGLHEALQTHAARLPVSVTVEVEPVMRGRRLAQGLETALYFTALEGMTNAVKHAPGARVIVSLRADASRHAVVLEVHDDGPGFDTAESTSGRGVQNMTDRIHSVGGTLSVGSRRGAGTWIRAEVPEGAEVTELRGRAVTA